MRWPILHAGNFLLLANLCACQCNGPGLRAPADRAVESTCSLELMDSRRTLVNRSYVLGSPALLVVESVDPASGEAVISSGDRVESLPAFAAKSAARAAGATDGYVVEVLDSHGGAMSAGTPVTDRAIVQLRNGEAGTYLVESHGSMVPGPRAQAARLKIFKVDMPDQTQPSTCDNRIRVHDYLVATVIHPSAWIAATATGSLASSPVTCRTEMTPGPPATRCNTTADGALVCAWVPACSTNDPQQAP